MLLSDLQGNRDSQFRAITHSPLRGLTKPITGGKKPIFDAREQQLKRISLPIINLEQLSDEHAYLYNQTWCALDALVEITNGALVVKPFRREPP